MGTRRPAAFLFAGLVAAGGCADVLGLGSLVPRPDGAGDVVVPDGPVGDDGGACALAVPPPRPAQDDPSDADITVVNVIRTVDLGERSDGSPPPFGYDLDQVNTCCGNGPESCVRAAGAPIHCDSEGGRDNAGGQMLDNIATFGVGVLDQNNLNANIDAGMSSLLVVLHNYNGQPNDTQVTLAVYTSNGLVRLPDGGRPPANWDGNDVWTTDQESVLGTDDAGFPVPLQFDTNAYVSNGTLVAYIAFPLVFGSGNGSGQTVTMSGSVVTGKLVPQGNTLRIDDGQGSGRLRVTNLFVLLHNIPDPFNVGGYICPGTLSYQNGKDVICKYADIMGDKTEDNQGFACDALAVSLAFTTFPAQIGPITAGGTPNSPCLDAGVDNCP